MSFSTLRDIEACPLRWALRRSAYPFNVETVGYPSRLSRSALAGTIVHTALERVIKSMKNQTTQNHLRKDANNEAIGKPLIADAVVGALRTLGGISTLLDSVISGLSREWNLNPRIVARGPELEAEIRSELPSLRERFKHLLQNIDLGQNSPTERPAGPSTMCASPAAESRARLGMRASISRRGTGFERAELAPGLNSEVSLFNSELDWYGKADLIFLAEANCSIVDFKMGAEKEYHLKQILTYALLWARDQEVNPNSIPATNLDIIYSDKIVAVPTPDDESLTQLASELTERSGATRRAVSMRPVPARPSYEACEWCDVRQLCDTYWEPATRALMNAPDEMTSLTTSFETRPRSALETTNQLADLELVIVARQGEWSWHARILQSGALTSELDAGTEVLLRARPGGNFVGTRISPGTRVRVIGAHMLEASEDSANRPVALVGRGAEVFLLL